MNQYYVNILLYKISCQNVMGVVWRGLGSVVSDLSMRYVNPFVSLHSYPETEPGVVTRVVLFWVVTLLGVLGYKVQQWVLDLVIYKGLCSVLVCLGPKSERTVLVKDRILRKFDCSLRLETYREFWSIRNRLELKSTRGHGTVDIIGGRIPDEVVVHTTSSRVWRPSWCSQCRRDLKTDGKRCG